MATASKDQVIKLVEVPQDEITLKLSMDEAVVLKDVFYVIGGSHDRTRRGLINGIAQALYSAGVTSSRATDLYGSLEFKPKC